MKKTFLKIAVISALLTASFSCDLDGDLENPNEISVSGADPNLLMNGIQLDFADFYSYASGNSVDPTQTSFGPDRLMRMRAMNTGYRYQTAAQAQFLDDMWEWAYSKVLVNIETLIPLAEEKKLTTHVAAAKIMKAYTYITLVDLYGDVPQSSALTGPTGEFNPTVDGGEAIYDAAISWLGEARTELAKTGLDAGTGMTRDIYYGGSRVNWNALANTIELKALMNLRMISARTAAATARIDALITENKLIDTSAENFTYKYGTATVPYSRHPLYRQYYAPAEGGASGYINNAYMAELYKGKGVEDPRWRYYFYRQVGSITKAKQIDPKSIGCSQGAIPPHYVAGGYDFCTFEPGFFGRDHGDASGTPPDSPMLTCAGAYPAGGLVDKNSALNTNFSDPTQQGDGGNGAGIEPILMSAYTKYMIAEHHARKGDNAAAKLALEAAVKGSIAEVQAFATSLGQVVPAGLIPSTDAYWTAVSNLYDAAPSKVKVIGREFYAALWGNGIEAYNSYRRTSAPENMQATRQLNPGPWFRSLIYPAIYVNLNNAATQKDIDAVNKVFWDTNPDQLN
jgi:hypothetical protein